MRIAEEDCEVLALLLPTRWQQMAWRSGAIERLRDFPSPGGAVADANAACRAGLLPAGGVQYPRATVRFERVVDAGIVKRARSNGSLDRKHSKPSDEKMLAKSLSELVRTAGKVTSIKEPTLRESMSPSRDYL